MATGVLWLLIAGFALACGKSGASAGGNTTGGVVPVVAAENFYGDIVGQLGGSAVKVTSILSDPNADPHEYESSTSDAKAIAAAKLVVENGIGYDSFMDKLLSASPSSSRIVINAGDLLGKKGGDNPHVWYNVDWMAQVADKLTATLTQLDPAHTAEFTTRNQQFKTALQPIRDAIATMKGTYAGVHVTQTEAVFGYMGDALGLQNDTGEFQHAVEEGTDPSPQSVAQIDAEINQHQVRVVLYNSQTVSPVTDRVKALATQQHVPVVGVSETEPKGMNYEQWMLSQLTTLRKALGG